MSETATQPKEDNRPRADLTTKYNTFQDMLKFAFGNNAAKLILDEDDNVSLKTNYAPSIAAQVQATETAGLPSYAGIDAKDVIMLSAQQGKQNELLRQQSMDPSQVQYLGAMTQQLQAQPQLKMADMALRFEQALRGQDASSALQTQSDEAAMSRLKKKLTGAETVANIGAGEKLLHLLNEPKRLVSMFLMQQVTKPQLNKPLLIICKGILLRISWKSQ
jgi:hypothetical protein